MFDLSVFFGQLLGTSISFKIDQFSSVAFCFFFKQKTAYELRISDWSSDVCSSDPRVCRSPADRLAVDRDVAVAAHPAAERRLDRAEIGAGQHVGDRKSVV